MKGKFSVLMSLYCKESPDYFDTCLESIFNQDATPTEIVLVIDGPITGALQCVIDKWINSLNFNICQIKENVGLSAALNFGLSYCSYELVFRMDTDDICYSSRFQQQIDFMCNNLDIDICGSWATDIDECGNVIGERKVPSESDEIKKLIWSCPIIHPSVVFRKSRILKIGSYNTNAGFRQDDYDLWLRASDNNLKFYNLPFPLIYYRYPLSSQDKNTFRVGVERFRLGFPFVWNYDRRLSSILAIFYPVVRPCIPIKIRNIISKMDPRKS